MGRGALGLAPFPGRHHHVAVHDTGVEPHAITTQCLVDRLDDRMALFAGDVSGREVDHGPVVADGHEVASEGDLVAGQLDPHRGRLDRRPAGVELGRVVPEDRHVADVAPGWESLGDGGGPTHLRTRGEGGEVGHRRRLQGRAATQLLLRLVGRTIGHQHHILHDREDRSRSRGIPLRR